ncbi:uncharacterized protein CCOS01_02531 [Colletotrichum costaricense]|uniref:Uncharacterized protein n=1 Tax=Colletotrichum costaricense TaxID=1209916 RepID=A0AAI9Z7Y8_9PEZI|nr:uncharacterized protein CCOS01_02531 [Colletotrichum costaricense]KAK1537211.1 hypothetical protein CCOS01_02531 [Colletotrichum costaricense]
MDTQGTPPAALLFLSHSLPFLSLLPSSSLTSHSLPLSPRLSHTPSPLPLIHTPLVPHLSLSLCLSLTLSPLTLHTPYPP